MQIRVTAPPDGRAAGPVAARIPMERMDDSRVMAMVDEESGQPVPLQVDSRGRLCWWQGPLKPAEERTYRFQPAAFTADAQRVVVRERDAVRADFTEGDLTFAEYDGSPENRHPGLSAVASPSGRVLIGQEEASNRRTSPGVCWSGWGDVNGVDFWTGSGMQRHRRFSLSVSGPVFGRMSALIDWLDASGEPILTEHRVVTAYRSSDRHRIVDLSHRLIVGDNPVIFGDTVEGGICAIRVSGSLASGFAKLVRNSEGQTGIEECHGAAARWCDCTGQIDEQFFGVTLIDRPNNPGSPVQWCLEDSGLIAANPFGAGAFRDEPGGSGKRFAAGSVAAFRYRMILHENCPTADGLAAMCESYWQSLNVELS